MNLKMYKIKWSKVISSVISVGTAWMTLKIALMILYELKGVFEWFMPLIGYAEDTPLYYLFDEVQKKENGEKYLYIMFMVIIVIFVVSAVWLIRQNAGKKLLILEHSSLQNMNFSYDSEELEGYAVKKMSINQCKTINNTSLTLEAKVSLLITDVCNILPEINNYVNKQYQIGYAGIPVGNMPSAFLLGYELDDANKKMYFHKNRINSLDDYFHILKDEYNTIKMQVSHKENIAGSNGDLLVIIQLTQPIEDNDLIGVLNENDYVLRYEVTGQIDYDIINSSKQANEYAQQIVNDIAALQKRSNISKIKICVAASSDFVFALGTKFSKTQNIDVILYQFDRNKYSWGINATKKTAVINNTYCQVNELDDAGLKENS